MMTKGTSISFGLRHHHWSVSKCRSFKCSTRSFIFWAQSGDRAWVKVYRELFVVQSFDRDVVLFFFQKPQIPLQNAFPPDKNFLVLSCWMILPLFLLLLIVMLLRKKFLLQFPKNPLLDFPESWLQHSICPGKLSQSPSFKELRKFKSPRKVECWWVKMTDSGV